MPCRKPTVDGAFGQHCKDGRRARYALEALRAKLLQYEEITNEEPGRLGNGHHARFGGTLKARRKIWSVADNRLLLRRPLADKIADDHKARCNTNPRLKRMSACDLQPGYGP